MNSKFISAAAVVAASPAASTVQPASCADALIGAANLLLTDLERGVAIDARALRAAMIASFGASDAEGAWDWKTAYYYCVTNCDVHVAQLRRRSMGSAASV